MKRFLRLALWPVMLFLIICLVLSIREGDLYPLGSLVPPEGAALEPDELSLRRIVPDRFVHRCAVCGECAHAIEILASRRVLRLVDHDGWYKLFWAADDVYYYEDPAPFAAALTLRTAREPTGTWTFQVRIGPALHEAAGAHECPRIPALVDLHYALETSPEPIPDAPADAAEGLAVPETLSWLTYPYDRPPLPPVLHFGWRLTRRSVAQEGPCPCAKP